jgi:hypothetical protein
MNNTGAIIKTTQQKANTMTLKVKEIESLTPGGRHVWYILADGSRIRKPVGNFDNLDFSELGEKTVLVERELLNWGKWLLKCTVGGLDYPSQSTLVTALQGSRSTSSPHLPTNPDAERTEAAVKRVEQDNKRWGEVLRKHYTRELNETADKIAAQLELPARTYRYYLNMGRKKVEFYLKRA